MDPSPPVKFPPLRPPPGAQARGLPTPASYRHGMPLIGGRDRTVPPPKGDRKRLWKWLGAAVVLHAILLAIFFLTPPWRLKWGPPPEAWVPVVSIPKPVESPPPAQPPAQPVPSQPTVPKAKGHRAAAAPAATPPAR